MGQHEGQHKRVRRVTSGPFLLVPKHLENRCHDGIRQYSVHHFEAVATVHTERTTHAQHTNTHTHTHTAARHTVETRNPRIRYTRHTTQHGKRTAKHKAPPHSTTRNKTRAQNEKHETQERETKTGMHINRNSEENAKKQMAQQQQDRNKRARDDHICLKPLRI